MTRSVNIQNIVLSLCAEFFLTHCVLIFGPIYINDFWLFGILTNTCCLSKKYIFFVLFPAVQVTLSSDC